MRVSKTDTGRFVITHDPRPMSGRDSIVRSQNDIRKRTFIAQREHAVNATDVSLRGLESSSACHTERVSCKADVAPACQTDANRRLRRKY